jgi:Zonular occludens toxin (Zot)
MPPTAPAHLPNGKPPSLSPGLFVHAWHLDPFSPLILLVALFGGVGFVVWLWSQLRAEQGSTGGGGLNYVVGPMGSGKSMYGVRMIVRYLRAGRFVVTNVRLLDGWEKAVARKLFPRERSAEKRAARERWLLGHYKYQPALREAMRYIVPCGICAGDPRECGHSGPEQEGRAVFVWDESHNDLNNRDYAGHGIDKLQRDVEREHRRLVLRWATQLRKLGYVGYLLSQHQENTDAQLRRVCNYIIRLQNQRHRGIGVLLPKRLALFLVYWYPAHLADGTLRVRSTRTERYFLPWHRTLYDSWEVYHGLHTDDSEEGSPILLSAEDAPAGPAQAGAGASATAAAAAAALTTETPA